MKTVLLSLFALLCVMAAAPVMACDGEEGESTSTSTTTPAPAPSPSGE